MRLLKAKGASMSPIINDGDIMLVIKPRTLRAGLVYIVNHPELGRIVKRLDRIENNKYFFVGENNNSTPPTLISPVTAGRIIGLVMLALGKYGLRRLI